MMPIGTLRNVSMSYTPSQEQLDFVKHKTSFTLTTTVTNDKRHQKGLLKSKSEKPKWNPKIKNIALMLGKMGFSQEKRMKSSLKNNDYSFTMMILPFSLRTFGEMTKRKRVTDFSIFLMFIWFKLKRLCTKYCQFIIHLRRS